MKLYAYCHKCRAEMPIKPTEPSRYDLSNQKGGNEFNERCPECSFVNRLHVNDVKALASGKSLLLISGIILLLAIIAFFAFKSMGVLVISTLPAVVIGIIYTNQNSDIDTFNRHKLTRKK